MLKVAPAWTVIAPVPLSVPLVQVMVLVTTKFPAPVKVPPPTVKISTEVSDESVQVPELITAVSPAAGTPLGLQLAKVNQSVPLVGVQLYVIASADGTAT